MSKCLSTNTLILSINVKRIVIVQPQQPVDQNQHFQFLATITKPHMNAFHFYRDDRDNRLLCRVNRCKDYYNEMEYYPKEKWLVLKDFMAPNAGIKGDGKKNVKIKGIKILGLRIEDYILNKIFWNNHYNIKNDEFTYSNYLNYLSYIKNRRGFLVRVCEFEKKCGSAIIVSTIKGAKIQHYNIFMAVKKALDTKPRNSKPLIYHLTDKYYFIALRTSKRFVCYKCITGKYYRNSYLYDLDRYGWKSLEQEQGSANDSSMAE